MPTITCTEKQLKLIQEAVEFTSRFDCGQLGFTYMPYASTKQYWKSTGEELTKWLDKRDEMEKHFAAIKKIWWDLEPNPNWGVGYDDDADALFDMYQVIRHEMWKAKHKDGDPHYYSHDEYPATQFGKEELIKVKMINESLLEEYPWLSIDIINKTKEITDEDKACLHLRNIAAKSGYVLGINESFVLYDKFK